MASNAIFLRFFVDFDKILRYNYSIVLFWRRKC